MGCLEMCRKLFNALIIVTFVGLLTAVPAAYAQDPELLHNCPTCTKGFTQQGAFILPILEPLSGAFPPNHTEGSDSVCVPFAGTVRFLKGKVDKIVPISSAVSATHQTIDIESARLDENGNAVTIATRVHNPPKGVPAKALMILIPGGRMSGNLSGSGPNNFLIRSAHLFAKRGYRVVGIGRPSDHTRLKFWTPDVIQNGVLSEQLHGASFDPYRVSVEHLIDLIAIINANNKIARETLLPVLLLGTSRGSISAMRWKVLAEAISLSAPVTVQHSLEGTVSVGSNAPAAQPDLHPSSLDRPACVHWHACDLCPSTTPDGAADLLADLKAVGSAPVGGGGLGGGYRQYRDICGPLSFHGFAGMEDHAVKTIVSCLGKVHPKVSRAGGFVSAKSAVFKKAVPSGKSFKFSLRKFVKFTRNISVPIVFELPAQHSALAAPAESRRDRKIRKPRRPRSNLRIDQDGTVYYRAPKVRRKSIDQFVYTIRTKKGRVSHNIVSITVVPN